MNQKKKMMAGFPQGTMLEKARAGNGQDAGRG